jgi:predicted Fe-Mo cluster-binding NifX family protein
MKVCFPVEQDKGFESKVYNHFGSAPMFVVVDTETNAVETINNRDQRHMHGACNPMKALDNEKVDSVVVGGIGAGALTKFNEMGIRVHRAQAPTIKENLVLFLSEGLPVLTLQGCCGRHNAGHGHGQGGGCAH